MSQNEILRKSLFEIKEDLDKKRITSVELTKLCLKRIAECDQEIGAMIHIDGDLAVEQAKQSDTRRQGAKLKGMLDGIPISLKDMILAKGYPCTAASKILEGYMPPYDSRVTANLREQGAVILGKANQDEFAMGSSNEASGFKPCANPWNTKYTPGGSSGGSAAALGAGMCFASYGTDTGGSIRQPAAYCGLVGLKPSYGRVSRFGIIAFASSLDQVGPFARTVRDSAILLSAIAGYDESDSTSVNTPAPDYVKNININIKGKKIGVPKEYFGDGISDSVKSSVEASIDALRKNGAEIIDIELPHTKYAVATYYIIATAEASSNLSRYDGVRYGPRINTNGDLGSLYEQTRGQLFGTEVKRRIMLGTYVLSAGYYDAYYLHAQKVRRLFANDFENAFKKVDAIISPTTPCTAFKLGEKVEDPVAMYLNDVYTISANLAGLCAISIPTGVDENGLPIGTQLMAKPFDEQTLFDVGCALESSIGFNEVSPYLR